jgi:GDP-L-fucose synthase
MKVLERTRVYVAGSTGMVGRAVIRALERHGCTNILTTSSADLDLREQDPTRRFFEQTKPEIVILAAAKVGGIAANDSLRGDFIYDNLMIEANTISAALDSGTQKLIFLGSSCIYPRLADQPIAEEALMTGPIEITNEPYAIAKIAGVKLCESFYRQHGANFYSVMPTNLYGPFDNFDLTTSHVMPALIRKFHEGKIRGISDVEVWGTGKPRREFLHVDDLARAIVKLAADVDARDIYHLGVPHVNVGSGSDISISELAGLVADVVGFEGRITFDPSRPDGTPRKLLDTTRMNNLGWTATTPLRDGVESTYQWFLNNAADARASHNG